MKVIIAEKPSLARNIVDAIGNMKKNNGYFSNNDYIVTWVFGHLFSLYDIEDYDITQQQATKENKSVTPNNQNSNNSKITVEKAKEISLKHANLKDNQVVFDKTEMDYDNGVQVYDIEFHYNNIEYNYEIDANTGNILSYSQD